jgi:hypothetical protein
MENVRATEVFKIPGVVTLSMGACHPEVGVLANKFMRKGGAAPSEVVRVARSRHRRHAAPALAEDSGDAIVLWGSALPSEMLEGGEGMEYPP